MYEGVGVVPDRRRGTIEFYEANIALGTSNAAKGGGATTQANAAVVDGYEIKAAGAR